MDTHSHVHAIPVDGAISVEDEQEAWQSGDAPCVFCALTAADDEREELERIARYQTQSWGAPTDERESEYAIRRAAWVVSQLTGHEVVIFPGYGQLADGARFGWAR